MSAASRPREIERLLDSVELFDYQREALAKLIDVLADRESAVLEMPPGLGKTVVACALARTIGAERVLVIVPSVPLAHQWGKMVPKLVGSTHFVRVVTGEVPPRERKRALSEAGNVFVVATPQSLVPLLPKELVARWRLCEGRSREPSDLERFEAIAKRLGAHELLKDFDLAVFDEVHEYVGAHDGRLIAVLSKAAEVRRLGLTATPRYEDRVAREWIGQLFETVVRPSSMPVVPVKLVIAPLKIPKTVLAAMKTVSELAKSLYMYYKEKAGEEAGTIVRSVRDLQAIARRGGSKARIYAVKALAYLGLSKRLWEEGYEAVKHYKALRWMWRDIPRFHPMPQLALQMLSEALATLDAWSRPIEDATLEIIERYVVPNHEKIIVFTETIEAAKRIQQRLNEIHGDGFAALLLGKEAMSEEEQRKAVELFRSRAKVLVCTRVGELGIDIPSADAEVWLSLPGNLGTYRFVQRMGRVMRRAPGKSWGHVYALVKLSDLDRVCDMAEEARLLYGVEVVPVALLTDLETGVVEGEVKRVGLRWTRYGFSMRIELDSGDIILYRSPELSHLAKLLGAEDLEPLLSLISIETIAMFLKKRARRARARGVVLSRREGVTIIDASPRPMLRGMPIVNAPSGELELEVDGDVGELIARELGMQALLYVRFVKTRRSKNEGGDSDVFKRVVGEAKAAEFIARIDELREKLGKALGIEFDVLPISYAVELRDIIEGSEKLRRGIVLLARKRLSEKLSLAIAIVEPGRYGRSSKVVIYLDPVGLVLFARPVIHDYDNLDRYVSRLVKIVGEALREYEDFAKKLGVSATAIARIVLSSVADAQRLVAKKLNVVPSVRFMGFARLGNAVAAVTPSRELLLSIDHFLVLAERLAEGSVSVEEARKALIHVLVHELIHVARSMLGAQALSTAREEEETQRLTEEICREIGATRELVEKVFFVSAEECVSSDEYGLAEQQ
ncbi:MAG: DEAD/DEAH box helicase family protein [Crenarchaeota archaeon]|nr:DEAD/DEAH box helicase family protein [Thermoproteota archaeon]